MSASDSKADIEVAESAGQVTSGDEGKAAEGDTGFDAGTKKLVQKLPLFSINAGPRDGNEWKKRLKQEYQALIRYIQMNKANDNDWFIVKPDKTGLRWTGKCWYFYKQLKYTFDLEFEIPVTYPMTNPDLCIPELEGKTPKMYRGGKICLSIHFMPLWARNAPRFGIAHALALGLAPWLAAEVPHLVDVGLVTKKD